MRNYAKSNEDTLVGLDMRIEIYVNTIIV